MRKRKSIKQLRLKGQDPYRSEGKRMTLDEYNAYLKSPAWFKLRDRVFRIQGRQCRNCGTGKRLTLHHKTYVRIGREKPKDMEVLCWKCHTEHHGDAIFTGQQIIPDESIPLAPELFWVWNPDTQSYQLREEYRRA